MDWTDKEREQPREERGRKPQVVEPGQLEPLDAEKIEIIKQFFKDAMKEKQRH
jgi:hypothetical protein